MACSVMFAIGFASSWVLVDDEDDGFPVSVLLRILSLSMVSPLLMNFLTSALLMVFLTDNMFCCYLPELI